MMVMIPNHHGRLIRRHALLLAILTMIASTILTTSATTERKENGNQQQQQQHHQQQQQQNRTTFLQQSHSMFRSMTTNQERNVNEVVVIPMSNKKNNKNNNNHYNNNNKYHPHHENSKTHPNNTMTTQLVRRELKKKKTKKRPRPYLFFGVADDEDDHIGGIYSTKTSKEGKLEPYQIYRSTTKLVGLTVSCGEQKNLYWVTGTDKQVMKRSLNNNTNGNVAAGTATTAAAEYESVVSELYGSDMFPTSLRAIAINERQLLLILGSRQSLLMVNLDGKSQSPIVLDNLPDKSKKSHIPAVTIDPTTEIIYYGGRDGQGNSFVKYMEPPYEKGTGKLLHQQVSSSSAYYPRDIAVDSDSAFLYWADNNNIFKASILSLREGRVDRNSDLSPFQIVPESQSSSSSSPRAKAIYHRSQFGYGRLRTLDLYRDHIFIGVIYTKTYHSGIWGVPAEPSHPPSSCPGTDADYDSTPYELYRFRTHNGIRSLVVATCLNNKQSSRKRKNNNNKREREIRRP